MYTSLFFVFSILILSGVFFVVQESVARAHLIETDSNDHLHDEERKVAQTSTPRDATVPDWARETICERIHGSNNERCVSGVELWNLIDAKNEGKDPSDQWNTATMFDIAMCESLGFRFAVLDTRGQNTERGISQEQSFGLLAVNILEDSGHTDFENDDLYNPAVNIDAAYKLFEYGINEGWSKERTYGRWGCYEYTQVDGYRDQITEQSTASFCFSKPYNYTPGTASSNYGKDHRYDGTQSCPTQQQTPSGTQNRITSSTNRYPIITGKPVCGNNNGKDICFFLPGPSNAWGWQSYRNRDRDKFNTWWQHFALDIYEERNNKPTKHSS